MAARSERVLCVVDGGCIGHAATGATSAEAVEYPISMKKYEKVSTSESKFEMDGDDNDYDDDNEETELFNDETYTAARALAGPPDWRESSSSVDFSDMSAIPLMRTRHDQSNNDENGDIEDESDLFLVKTASADESEALHHTVLQAIFALSFAGLGLVFTGTVLDRVQDYPSFLGVPELIIMYPALLGLKGNLEMTLASRLSTAANLGQLDKTEDAWEAVLTNMAVMQVQAIVVGAIAGLFALVVRAMVSEFNGTYATLLIGSSMLTASVASLLLGSLMCAIIIFSRKVRCNPDNIATPIAASMSDLVTIVILVGIAETLFTMQTLWLPPVIITVMICIVPFVLRYAWRHERSRSVLKHGWTPVLIAMVVSSFGGLILERLKYPSMAALQPVMCGVGGNTACIHASRVSTEVHRKPPGSFSKPDAREWALFLLLLFCVIPLQICLILLANSLEEKCHEIHVTIGFLLTYVSAAMLQVALLLLLASFLVRVLWYRHLDPDDHVFPYVAATGDLIGMGLLSAVFAILLSTEGSVSSCDEPFANVTQSLFVSSSSAISQTSNYLMQSSSALLSTVFPSSDASSVFPSPTATSLPTL